MASADDDLLLAALTRVRDVSAHARHDRAHDGAWRTIAAWLERRLPGRAKADLRQETLVKIVRYAASCQATSSGSAAAWVMQIARRTAIDDARSAHTSALDHALRQSSGDEDPLAAVAAPEGHAVASEATTDLAAELEDAIDQALAALHPTPAARLAPRAYARARLYRRLLGLTVAEVRARLDWHAPLSDDLISKWIERGQVPLDAALRTWIEGDPEARTAIGERLRERMSERRLDAGRPRPDRRTRPDGSRRRPSVAMRNVRHVGCGKTMTTRSGTVGRSFLRRTRRLGKRGGR